MKADAAFRADFDQSHATVWIVGRWLADLGFEVAAPVPALRPNAEERAAYADDGDLVIKKVVEVKRRSIDFTGAHDYPYDSVFVNEAYKLTRERLAVVWGYVVVNRAGTHAAVVHTNTANKWVTVERYDADQDRRCEFLACPVAHVKFFRLP